MFKSNFFAVIFCCLLKVGVLAQNVDFKVYYAPEMYTLDLQNSLKSNNIFVPYRLMLPAHIDPKNKGLIDKEFFVRNIEGFYPKVDSEGILCIDLENKVYQNLYKFDLNTNEYQEASNLFIWMVKKVKEMRPNVKVGFYGIPFRAYYVNKNNTSKLDSVLSKVDYIFPSLYTMYPNKQMGKSRNEKYLKENLEIALEFGVRLNKPVVPFIWNMVHPSNKLYGGQLVDKNEMLQNIEFIKKFEYKNTTVSGVVWWEPDYKYFFKIVKSNIVKNDNQDVRYIQSELFKDYLSQFIN